MPPVLELLPLDPLEAAALVEVEAAPLVTVLLELALEVFSEPEVVGPEEAVDPAPELLEPATVRELADVVELPPIELDAPPSAPPLELQAAQARASTATGEPRRVQRLGLETAAGVFAAGASVGMRRAPSVELRPSVRREH
jgi:hypothetical protein